MKDIELQAERKAFEAWWDKDEGIDNAGPWTPDSPIQFGWAAWRAAIEADRAQRVPDWWKLVPVEPTEEMLCAGDDVLREAIRDRCIATRMIYDAMLESTPAPAQQEPRGCGPRTPGVVYVCPEIDAACSKPECEHKCAAAQHQEPPQRERKPMTDEQAADDYFGRSEVSENPENRAFQGGTFECFLGGIRFAERHHGIKE